MKRGIVIIHSDTPAAETKEFLEMLQEGYVLDPELKIVRLDHAAIYHLIKPEEGDAETEATVEKVIVDAAEVPLSEVGERVADGWRVHALYAKTATMIREA